MKNVYLKGMPFFLILVVLLVVTNPEVVLAQDFPGSKDHPLISRYPRSVITDYRMKDFDEYVLILGEYVGRGDKVVPEKTEQLEGKVTNIQYKTPAGCSVLEVFRNYEMALKKAGFQTLFTCSN